MLTGQAIGAITFNRRRNLLNALGQEDSKNMNMIRETYAKELKHNEELLFGDKFRNKVEKEAKSEHKTVRQFLSPHRKFTFTHAQNKPNQTASPTKKTDGGERKFHGQSYSDARFRGSQKFEGSFRNKSSGGYHSL